MNKILQNNKIKIKKQESKQKRNFTRIILKNNNITRIKIKKIYY